MTKISASIVADSICNGHQITTMLVTFPRMILAEFNTHRMFSRNSASSRAIPFEKMLESVRADPFIPIAWQADHKGMQGSQYITDPGAIEVRRAQWLEAMDRCCSSAWTLHNGYSVVGLQEEIPGVTKQICNRLLEPFMWHTVLVTATEYTNFFHLRSPQYQIGQSPVFGSRKDCLDYFSDDPDLYQTLSQNTEVEWLQCNKGQAEIHMMALAEAMWDARNESTPKELKPSEWHIPYGENFDLHIPRGVGDEVGLSTLKMWLDAGGWNEKIAPYEVQLATGVCAKTSYTIVGDNQSEFSPTNLLDLHNSLLVRPYTNRKGVIFGPDDPKHMSPAEHCALAKGDGKFYANFRGWQQYRHMIPNENRQ